MSKKRVNILIVEDSEPIRKILYYLLREDRRNIDMIHTASSFERAKKRELSQYHIIFVDYHTNETINGAEFIKYAKESGAKATFIAMSSDDEGCEKMVEAGATKSIRGKDLLKYPIWIKKHLERSRIKNDRREASKRVQKCENFTRTS